jgi:hypothetical protein
MIPKIASDHSNNLNKYLDLEFELATQEKDIAQLQAYVDNAYRKRGAFCQELGGDKETFFALLGCKHYMVLPMLKLDKLRRYVQSKLEETSR